MTASPSITKRGWIIGLVTRGVPWRRAAITGIKVIHSAIFLVNSASVIHIFYVGIRGHHPSRLTRFALVAALIESAVFVANRGRCPLTGLVEHLGAANGRVSDIFLPRCFADRIPQLCAPLLIVGLLGLLVNALRHAHAADSTRTGERLNSP